MTSAPSAARVKRAGKKRAKAQPKASSAKVVQVASRRPAASPDIEVGRRVLMMEANGLAALAANLDGSFGKAVDILMGVSREGGHARAIISGMGKSGHVARKIAATLASTGTPAHFVHPAEASHGDLGMVLPGDVVLGDGDGVLVVAWTRRAGSWLRWQSPPLTSRGQLSEAWQKADIWSQNPGDAERSNEVSITPLDNWQIFYYRSDAWTNPLSSDASGAAGAASPGGVAVVPDGVRVVLTLPPGQALAGTLVRDWVRPTIGGGKS